MLKTTNAHLATDHVVIAALSNLYYPASNRGAGLVFSNFFLTTGERMLSSMLQEFVIGRITTRQKARD